MKLQCIVQSLDHKKQYYFYLNHKIYFRKKIKNLHYLNKLKSLIIGVQYKVITMSLKNGQPLTPTKDKETNKRKHINNKSHSSSKPTKIKQNPLKFMTT